MVKPSVGPTGAVVVRWGIPIWIGNPCLPVGYENDTASWPLSTSQQTPPGPLAGMDIDFNK